MRLKRTTILAVILAATMMSTTVYADTSSAAPEIKSLSGTDMIEELDNRGEDYHFWQVGKTYAAADEDINVYENMDEKADVIGEMPKGATCCILEEEDGWAYIESADVRGFVKRELISLSGEDTGVYAVSLVDSSENEAYTYTRTTTNKVVTDTVYGIGREDADVLDGDGGTVVGTISASTWMYILEEEGDYYYIDSGSVRGYVAKDSVIAGTDADALISSSGLGSYETAEAAVDPSENSAYYASLLTAVSGRPNADSTGEEIAEYAVSFVGASGVWNGTSLENGLDSAGVIRNIFKRYGIILPGTVQAQVREGTIVAYDEAEPGDLLFYRSEEEGEITDVALLTNDGMVTVRDGEIVEVEAAADLLAWCVRVIPEETDADTTVSYDPIVATTDATVITPGETCGGVYTYEKWDRVWASGTKQRRLHDAYEAYDEEGFGRIEDRYVIACTTTFGQVGDMIDFELSDGTIIKTVVGDIKSQRDAGCTIYGHKNGANVIEFIVLSSMWYNTGHANPGTASCHPEWGGLTVTRAYNYGSIF